MALLNPPQILPNVARTIYRALLQADGNAMARDDLAKLLAPTSLTKGDGTGVGPGSKALDDTLNACVTIRLLERDADAISLHRGLPDSARDRRRRDEGLRELVRELIFAEDINAGLWTSTEGARDLTRALAWFLAQNPLNAPGPWNEPDGVDTAQDRQLAGDEKVFSNDTRWGAFVRWATFLGFGWQMPRENKDVLIPDPTAAMRSVVAQVVPKERQEIGSVLEALASVMPVIDGGKFRREVEGRMKPGSYQADDQLSPSLAHALLRLRDLQILVLENLPDAPVKVRVPEGFGPEPTVTHIHLAETRGRRR